MDNAGQAGASSSHNEQREYIVNHLDHRSVAKGDESIEGSDGEGGVSLGSRSLLNQSSSSELAGSNDILNKLQALSLSSADLQETVRGKNVQWSASTAKKTPWSVPRHARAEALNPEVSSFKPKRTHRRRGKDHDYPGVVDAAAHPGGSAVSRKALADSNCLLDVDTKRHSHRHMHNTSLMTSIEHSTDPTGDDSTWRLALTTNPPTTASISPDLAEQHITVSEQAAQQYQTELKSPEAHSAQATAPQTTSFGQPTQGLATPQPSDDWQQYAPGPYDFIHAPEQRYAFHYPAEGHGYRSRLSAGTTATAPSFVQAPPYQLRTGNSAPSASTFTTLQDSRALGALGSMETRHQFGSNIIPSNHNIATEVGGAVSSSRSGNSKSRRIKIPSSRHKLPRPKPTRAYLEKAGEIPKALGGSRELLVILDLNGTLGDRKGSKSAFHPRPGCQAFIDWLFANHCVLVWSSATRQNVLNMSKKIMSPEQLASSSFAGFWSREDLQLTEEQSRQKIVVYKQLSWVWQEADVQIHRPISGARWDQTNTVLIDDTEAKGAAEPHNLIIVPEFSAGMDDDTHLLHVQEYLSGLASTANVSAAMRANPFKAVTADDTATFGAASLGGGQGRYR